MAELLHLRVVVTRGRRTAVLEALERSPAVCNLTVFADAAQRPAGDVVELDVPREVINGLLDELEDLGVAEEGSITVFHTELTFRATPSTPSSSAGRPVRHRGVGRGLGQGRGTRRRPLVRSAHRAG